MSNSGEIHLSAVNRRGRRVWGQRAEVPTLVVHSVPHLGKVADDWQASTRPGHPDPSRLLRYVDQPY